MLLAVVCVAPLARGGEAYPDPFEDARYVPSTVTQYFCFVEAGESLRELMGSSLAPGLKAFYEKCQSGESWRDLAAATGVESSKLFDMLVSRRVTLVTDQDQERRDRRDEALDFSRWVLMAKVDEPFAKDLLRILDGRVREFVDDTPLYVAGSGELRFAYLDGRFYLTASKGEALLRSMLARSMGAALADDVGFREARGVGPGDFGMFKRGSANGHWQAGSARVHSDRLSLNFASKHTARGGDRDRGDAINLGLLSTLAEDAIYVGIERTPEADDPACENRFGPGPLVLVPIARAKPSLLNHLGPTMFTVIEMPESSGSSGAGIPAMTVGIELREPADAVGELDEFMGRATMRLSESRRQRAALTQPPAVSFTGESPNAVRVAEWRGAGLQLEQLGLSGTWPERVVWSSVHSDDRTWWVASTDEDCQRRIAGKLQSVAPQCRKSSSTQARGMIVGSRLAELLKQWPAVNAAAESKGLAELAALGELLSAVSDIRWRVTQRTPERTETGISISWKRDSRE